MHCALRHVATLSYRALVDESAACSTSVEQAADGTETAAVDRLLPPPTENIFVSVCQRTEIERSDGSVMRPRSFSRRRNINALVTVTESWPLDSKSRILLYTV